MIHGIDFENDDCFKEVTRSLTRIMGDSRTVTKDDRDTFIAEQVEERLAEAMEGIASNKKRKKSRNGIKRKVGNGGAKGKKIKKPINKKDDEGNRLRCRECESYKHVKRECEDKGKGENKKNSNGKAIRCSSCDLSKYLLTSCQHS